MKKILYLILICVLLFGFQVVNAAILLPGPCFQSDEECKKQQKLIMEINARLHSTPTPTPTPTPLPTPTPTPTPIPTPSECVIHDQYGTVIGSCSSTPTPTPQITPTITPEPTLQPTPTPTTYLTEQSGVILSIKEQINSLINQVLEIKNEIQLLWYAIGTIVNQITDIVNRLDELEGTKTVLSDGFLVRSAYSPKIYKISGEYKIWITSEEIFNQCGFDWQSVLIIPKNELDNYITSDKTITFPEC